MHPSLNAHRAGSPELAIHPQRAGDRRRHALAAPDGGPADVRDQAAEGGVSASVQRERVARAASQLCLLYELRYRAGRRPDPMEVARFAARRARELFNADGCGLLLLDADRSHLHFAVASQSTAREDSTS